VANRLLARLPARARNEILNCCEEVELAYGELLSESAEIVRYAYFPADGFISLRVSAGRHANDVSLVGNEGMFGPSSILGLDVSPLRALVQGSGHALRIGVADLRRATDDYAPLRDTLNRYLCVTIAELAQAALCNGSHPIEARLAHWLLMTHDRAHSDRLRLTHGCWRGCSAYGVAASASPLPPCRPEGRSAIVEQVRILDRSRLEDASCVCYRASKSMYRRISASGADSSGRSSAPIRRNQR
jgi:hypothetical protein